MQTTVTEKSNVRRVPTGITELDQALSGGFPAQSAILVMGPPGSGKTIFGMTFLWNAISNMEEKGMYVSFGEGKEQMYDNMKEFGMDFQKMEDAEKFKFLLLMPATGTAMGDEVAKIPEMVMQNGIKRVVIDSISAITQAFDHRYEGRQVIQTVVQKLLRSLGCTTLVISEYPYKISEGLEYEGFVVDGIINLSVKIPRILSIHKMRGTPVVRANLVFSLSGGFNLIKTTKGRPTSLRRWKPILAPDDYVSTGTEDFDDLLGGGFKRGTYAVLVADSNVSLDEIYLFTHAAVRNFLSLGCGVIYLPPGGVDARGVIADLQPHLQKENLDTLRVAEELKGDEPITKLSENARYTVLLKGGRNNIDTDTYMLFNTESNLKRQTNDKPVLRVMGYDTMESKYSEVIQKLYNEIGFAIMSTRSNGAVTIGLARPNMTLLPKVLDMADWHFTLTKEANTLLFRGIKPQTSFYAVENDVSKGYPKAKLIPMM